MKILIIGGLGAIGTPLVKELRKRGHDTYVADRFHHHDPQYMRCNIQHFHQVKRMLEWQKFDVVYNLAAEFGRYNGEDYYEDLWMTNAIGMKNILRMQEELKFKLIFTSSSEIYGDYTDTMFEDVPDKVPINQLNDYAISKWVNELQIRNSMSRFRTETVILRLFNTYGPGEYFSPYRSVICQFIYKALHNEPHTVYLDHHRTSSYVDDTINAMANIVNNFKSGEVYNLCGEEYHDIKKLSDMILEEMGKEPSDDLVIYKKIEEHNTLDKKGDNSKAKKDLGFKPSVGLREGIKRTIEWQKKIYGVK